MTRDEIIDALRTIAELSTDELMAMAKDVTIDRLPERCREGDVLAMRQAKNLIETGWCHVSNAIKQADGVREEIARRVEADNKHVANLVRDNVAKDQRIAELEREVQVLHSDSPAREREWQRQIKELQSTADRAKAVRVQLRSTMADAGVKCYFGKCGVPDVKGFPRDMADCLKDFVQQLAAAKAEVERLKAGKFTEEEIHDICHNLHGTVDARGFADGCNAEQTKLYGYAPDADEVKRLKAEVGRLSRPVEINDNDAQDAFNEYCLNTNVVGYIPAFRDAIGRLLKIERNVRKAAEQRAERAEREQDELRALVGRIGRLAVTDPDTCSDQCLHDIDQALAAYRTAKEKENDGMARPNWEDSAWEAENDPENGMNAGKDGGA